MLVMLRDICRAEWGGDYPQPAEISLQHGEYVINFRNHPDDRKPSTFVKGNYRQLQILGKNAFGSRKFFLPDHMTANELVEVVAMRCGVRPSRPSPDAASPGAASSAGPKTKAGPPRQSTIQDLFRDISGGFARTIRDETAKEAQDAYREKLRFTIQNARAFINPMVIKSVEGIGKTSALFRVVANEVLDEAISLYPEGQNRFGCFAFRKREQAEAKAQEFRETGRHAPSERPQEFAPAPFLCAHCKPPAKPPQS